MVNRDKYSYMHSLRYSAEVITTLSRLSDEYYQAIIDLIGVDNLLRIIEIHQNKELSKEEILDMIKTND